MKPSQGFARPLVYGDPGPLATIGELTFTADVLTQVCRSVMAFCRAVGFEPSRARTFSVILTDIAEEGARHGDGQGSLQWWTTPRWVVGEVADRAPLAEPLIARRREPPDGRGRALWLAEHLCDLTEVDSDGRGTVTRIHLRR